LSNYIPEEKIEEIKNAADIVEVISDYVMLKKTGQNYSGLCPFHSEKLPSFTVSPVKQIFHCFGCNTGGNIYTFLMKHDGLSFPEAVRFLARRYGIDLPARKMTQAARKQITERERLIAVNHQAAEFYHRCLFSSQYGKSAMTYLGKRGFTKSIIEAFKLGYAPRSWDSIHRYFLKKGISNQFIQKAGLIIRRKSQSGYYDRFRERIIFPILNANKQVIGFGGRVLDDSLPKYLNSPETPVYNKSRSLYGLHNARNKCRETKTIYIVEGYFDLLALHQHGIENSAATLGTALTVEHIKTLKGLAEKVILIFDSDEAGIKASLRSVGLFIEKGMQARVILLPAGHDPDSYLFKFGPEAFYQQTDKAMGIMPFLLTAAEKKYGLSVDGKLRIIDELSLPLASIEGKDARALHIKEISERLGLKEYILLEKVRDTIIAIEQRKTRQRRRSNHAGDAPSARRPGLKRKQQSASKTGTALERQILTMMMQFPEIMPEIIDLKVLEHFTDDTLKSLGGLILNTRNENAGDVSNLILAVDDEEKRNILASLVIKEELWNLQDCRKVLTKFIQKSPLRYDVSLMERIKAAEKDNDQALLLKLLDEKQKIAVRHDKQKRKIGTSS
jgi:DNA primase